jgi:hypothetical protein
MSNDELYMTVDEQRASIESAGFASVRQVLSMGGMVLHHAEERKSDKAKLNLP